MITTPVHTVQYIFQRCTAVGKILCVYMLLVLSSISAQGQIMDETFHVDTLSIKQRIAVRTNLVDWAAVIPNVGVEFDFHRTNYNRWTAGLYLRWRPKGSATYIYPLHYGIFEISLEGKEYWRERKTERAGYLAPHSSYWDKLWSCRTAKPSHPKWIFYRGGFLAYGQYSFILGENHWGRQGDYIMAGVSWGFIKPFQAYRNGTSLDWEFGISAGFQVRKSQKVKADQYDNCYVTDENGMSNWHFSPIPLVRDIHVGLIYRMGNYPIQKKYRWRYDCDMAYHDRIDSIFAQREAQQYVKITNDSIYKVVSTRYKQIYDSLAVIQHVKDVAEMKAERARLDSLKRDEIAANRQAKMEAADAKTRARMAARDSALAVHTAAAKAKVAARDSAIAVHRAAAKAKVAARDSAVAVRQAAIKAKIAEKNAARDSAMAVHKAEAKAKVAARDSAMAVHQAEAKAKANAKMSAREAEIAKNRAAAKARADEKAQKAQEAADAKAEKTKSDDTTTKTESTTDKTTSKSESTAPAKLTHEEKMKQKIAEIKAKQKKMAEEAAAKKAAKLLQKGGKE